MKKTNHNPENDILGALLGAAILGSIAEEAKKAEQTPDTEATPVAEPNENMERAKALREQYEAFIEVGFNEEQATAFIAALLH